MDSQIKMKKRRQAKQTVVPLFSRSVIFRNGLALGLALGLTAIVCISGGDARTHGHSRHAGAGSSSSGSGSGARTRSRGASNSAASQVISGGSVAAAVDSWLKRPEIAHSRIGVEVMELPSGRLIYSHDGDRRLTPASTAKVMTTACIYELLGANYQYKTALVANGPIVNGVLKGDLVLEPSQDPSFDRGDLMKLVEDLKNGRNGEKVNQVEGHAFVGENAGGQRELPTHLVVRGFWTGLDARFFQSCA